MCIQFTCTSCHLCFNDHCKDKPADAKPVKDDSEPVSNDSTTAASEETKSFTASNSDTLASTGNQSNESKICPGAIQTSVAMKCETCIRIKGAIRKLESLVFQAPFLETDGLAGLETLAAWEAADYKELLCGRKKGWDDEIASREERHEVQERIEKMGLDGIGDGRKEHQGFDMSVTPPKNGEEEEENECVW